MVLVGGKHCSKALFRFIWARSHSGECLDWMRIWKMYHWESMIREQHSCARSSASWRSHPGWWEAKYILYSYLSTQTVWVMEKKSLWCVCVSVSGWARKKKDDNVSDSKSFVDMQHKLDLCRVSSPVLQKAAKSWQSRIKWLRQMIPLLSS